MIADDGSAWSGSGADGTPMIEGAIGSDLSGPVHADGTDMRYEEARSDFSGGIDIDVCDQREKLSCHAKNQPHGRQKPLGSAP